MKKAIIITWLLTLTLLVMTSCRLNSLNKPSAPTNALKLDKRTLTVEIGQTEKLAVTVVPEGRLLPEIIWSSSDEKIAEVDDTGQLKGLSAGECIITVKTKDEKLLITSSVTVKPKTVKVLKIDKETVALEVGGTAQLTAIISPSDAVSPDIEWISSEPKLVTVDNNGLIRAVAPGKTKISLVTKDRSLSALCFITVNGKSVTGIKLNKTALTLQTGSYEKIEVTFEPSDAGNKNRTYTSSNPSIASVSASGSIKGEAPGTAVITATSEDGGFTAQCTVTVTQQPVPSGGTPSKPESKLLFKKNDGTLMRLYLSFHAGTEDPLDFTKDVEIYLNVSDICIKFNDKSLTDPARIGYYGTGIGVVVKSEATGEILFKRERTDP